LARQASGRRPSASTTGSRGVSIVPVKLFCALIFG
jgi:hypothetical protein